jgi:hypothetical protein
MLSNTRCTRDVGHWSWHKVSRNIFMNGYVSNEMIGFIPGMLPFGFADAMFSTLDIPTLYDTVRITGREMIRNLLLGKI